MLESISTKFRSAAELEGTTPQGQKKTVRRIATATDASIASSHRIRASENDHHPMGMVPRNDEEDKVLALRLNLSDKKRRLGA